MGCVTTELRALLQDRRRKAELESLRREVRFEVGDEVLLDTEHAPFQSRSLLSPRWMGHSKVLACPAPNTYRLDVPAKWRVFPEFNVERLRPYLHGSAVPTPQAAAGDPAALAVQAGSCSSGDGSGCATAARTCWCVGLAATHQATRGIRWSG